MSETDDEKIRVQLETSEASGDTSVTTEKLLLQIVYKIGAIEQAALEVSCRLFYQTLKDIEFWKLWPLYVKKNLYIFEIDESDVYFALYQLITSY